MKNYRPIIPRLSAEEFFLGMLLGEKPVDCECSYCNKHTNVGRRVNARTVMCPGCFGEELYVRYHRRTIISRHPYKLKKKPTKWSIGRLTSEDEELFVSMRKRLRAGGKHAGRE